MVIVRAFMGLLQGSIRTIRNKSIKSVVKKGGSFFSSPFEQRQKNIKVDKSVKGE
jgi:6-phosphofructokinase